MSGELKPLRLSEIYLSTQGEGPRVGKPTVFVRFAGCNLRCPGWPCDTPHAIFPEKYRDEWQTKPVEDVVDWINDITGRNTDMSICYSGGEPFLQNHDALQQLTQFLADYGYNSFEAFTNGTVEYPVWAFDYIHFIMDWKLRGSGEDSFNATRIANLHELGTYDAIKFVVRDKEDFIQARELWTKYILEQSPVRVYAGVVWDVLETRQLVDWVLEARLPWWINVQVHQYIWPTNERKR